MSQPPPQAAQAPSGVVLPSAVAERVPLLKSRRCIFFDFGLSHLRRSSSSSSSSSNEEGEEFSEPIVAVITDVEVVVASFPRPTRPTRILPHAHIAGVSRELDRVVVHCSTGDPNLTLSITKPDTFVVFLVDLQDRAVGRALHFVRRGPDAATTAAAAVAVAAPKSASGGKGEAPASPGSRVAADSLALAAAAAASRGSHFDAELALGAVRLGRASRRSEPPPRELDEGSDASSVQTLEHGVAAPERPPEGDAEAEGDSYLALLPPVAIDGATLRRRLFYFFSRYDRARLPFIDAMARQHRDSGTQLLRDLERQYGPEPSRRRWAVRDRIAHQRTLHAQLSAQLARAQDELLLLRREQAAVDASLQRALGERDRRAAALAAGPRGRSLAQPAAARREKQRQFSLIRVVRDDAGAAAAAACCCFFVAPFSFFGFVREQAARAHGAQLPPACVVQCVGEAGGSAEAAAAFRCNWAFLAGWALDFGPHSVAVPDAADAQRHRYVPSAVFWRQALPR